MVLLALFGGLALLLYGMQLCGEGMQRAVGGHLRHLLTSMTRTRLAVVMTALVLGGLAGACPAGAARYAGPSGSGATCSEAAPCDYETAIEGAPAGAE